MFYRLRMALTRIRLHDRAFAFAQRWSQMRPVSTPHVPDPVNPFRVFAEQRTTGRGIWKWDHYFDIYDRHFARFRHTPATVLEIGVYSGGSLEMWRDYFGPTATIIGVDIQPSVRAYEGPGTKIVIGDQGDAMFWSSALADLPPIDIVIDDGSHQTEHQIVTLESVLPRMRPGGVYLCEDIHDDSNLFSPYVSGLMDQIHAAQYQAEGETRSRVVTTPFQATVHSIHIYPFVTVIELRPDRLPVMVAKKRGTEWQAFLDRKVSVTGTPP
jgi:predicted O-methyltransferase YrrM